MISLQASSSVVLCGAALHAGGRAAVALARTFPSVSHGDAFGSRHALAPIVWAQGNAEATTEDLLVHRTDRGVLLRSRDGRIEIDLVEHLLAALGGLGVRGGIRIAIDAAELPLLDGGAGRFADALIAIDAPAQVLAPPLVVAREATLHHGMASYRFVRDAGMKLRVHVRFPPPVGEEQAGWDGDPKDFLQRIAPARTFGWRHELDSLMAIGRARGLAHLARGRPSGADEIDPASVIIFERDGCLPGRGRYEPGEVARHKLLDMIGDLAFYGGPPRGLIDAFAPGHTATHQVVSEALRAGILRRAAAVFGRQ